MGLTPKKHNPKPKYNWNQLNEYLKDAIDESNMPNPEAVIVLSNYAMTSGEIISELNANGYSVEYSDDPNVIKVH